MHADMIAAKQRLLGVWELVSYRRFRDGVFYRDTMGPNSKGRIMWSDTGHMSAFLLSAEWARAEKIPQTWQHFFSYSGRWELVDATTVAHYVDMASITDFIGRRMERYASWTEEGYLKLLTDGHKTAEGFQSRDELVWRKL